MRSGETQSIVGQAIATMKRAEQQELKPTWPARFPRRGKMHASRNALLATGGDEQDRPDGERVQQHDWLRSVGDVYRAEVQHQQHGGADEADGVQRRLQRVYRLAPA